jgi:small-conductance mechanosensitive channel
MLLFALALRTGIFAEGRFLGKLIDEWFDDTQEFVRIKLPHLLVALLIAFLLTRLLHLIAHRMIRVAEMHAASHAHISQVKTLAGVIRATGVTIIVLITGMQFLAALGVNLAPLLASAGVAGVAVGLAAQNIVKDMLNGVLILIEDQFSVGDTVRIAGASGTVETMTLRKTTVRDADGTLYVIPNSQITSVANLSAGYTVATVNVSVDYSANPDQVIELLARIANDLCESEAHKAIFLAEPKVLGVDAIKGSELIFPVVFKTKATKHFEPVREFRRRVRLALEEKNLLPGDPCRVFQSFSATSTSATRRPRPDASTESADPTAIGAQESNPFSGG